MKETINAALKKAGISRSQVSAYRFKDPYGTCSVCAPRTSALKSELIYVQTEGVVVERVWVNELNEVVIESDTTYLRTGQ